MHAACCPIDKADPGIPRGSIPAGNDRVPRPAPRREADGKRDECPSSENVGRSARPCKGALPSNRSARMPLLQSVLVTSRHSRPYDVGSIWLSGAPIRLQRVARRITWTISAGCRGETAPLPSQPARPGRYLPAPRENLRRPGSGCRPSRAPNQGDYPAHASRLA